MDNSRMEPAEPVAEPAAEPSAEHTEHTEHTAEPDAQPAAEPAAEPARTWQETLAYLGKVDPDAYAHAKGMQGDYTRKTQALAEQRKQLEARAEQLQRDEARIKNLMSSLSGTPVDELPDYDPFDPESVIAHTRQRIFDEHIKPMQEQQAQEQAQLDFQRVQAEHPDIFDDADLKAELVDFLQERPHYKLTDGIEVIRARMSARQQEADAARRQAERTASRTAALTATGGTRRHQARITRPARAELKKMSAREILALSKELDRG